MAKASITESKFQVSRYATYRHYKENKQVLFSQTAFLSWTQSEDVRYSWVWEKGVAEGHNLISYRKLPEYMIIILKNLLY